MHPFFEEIDVIVSRKWRFFSRLSDWNLGRAAGEGKYQLGTFRSEMVRVIEEKKKRRHRVYYSVRCFSWAAFEGLQREYQNI